MFWFSYYSIGYIWNCLDASKKDLWSASSFKGYISIKEMKTYFHIIYLLSMWPISISSPSSVNCQIILII